MAVAAEDASLQPRPRDEPAATSTAEVDASFGEAWLSMRSIALRTMALVVDADVVLRTYDTRSGSGRHAEEGRRLNRKIEVQCCRSTYTGGTFRLSEEAC